MPLKPSQQEQLENYFLKDRHLGHMIIENNSLTWWGKDQGYWDKILKGLVGDFQDTVCGATDTYYA